MKTALSVLVSLFIYSSAMSQNFFPVQEGDTLHYQLLWNYSMPGYQNHSYTYYKRTVTSTLFDTVTFLKVLDGSYYYNQQQQKLYTLMGNQRVLSVDFNTPHGNYFYGTVNQSPRALYEAGVYYDSLFTGSRDTSYQEPGGVLVRSIYDFTFTRNIGLTSYGKGFITSSEMESYDYKLIEAKGQYYSFTFPKPTFSVSAVPDFKLTTEFPFDISFTKNHEYPELIDSLCAFIKVYRGSNLILSRVSFPTSSNPNSFPINLMPWELAPGDVIKIKFLMSDTALFKNRIILPEIGSYTIIVVSSPNKNWFLQNPYPTISTLYGFEYRNPGILYVCGEAGTIMRSTDTGNTWEDISYDKSDYDFTSVSFPDINNGFAVNSATFSSGVFIFNTTNGGITWNKKQSPSPNSSTKIFFPTLTHGFILEGQSNSYSYTNNGGLNWNRRYPSFYSMEDIAFENNDEGIIVGSTPNYGYVYKTHDRGTNWVSKGYLPFGLKSCSYVNDTLVFASGDCLAKSVNGAETWTKVGYYHPSTMISFADISNGFSLFNGKIERTSDGGISWNNLNVDSNYHFTGVKVLDRNNVLLFGQKGLILKSTDGGVNWFSISRGSTKTLYGSFLIDDNKGWAVGENGIILKTINSGATWTEIQSITNAGLRSISFSDEENGLAVGDNGVILRTTNGGILWENESSGTSGNLNSITLLSNNYAFAAGNGVILKTTDGGLTWIKKDFQKVFKGISFSDVNTGTVVGQGGVILRTTNGGDSWIEQQSGVSTDLYAVDFKDSQNGTAVGDLGKVLTTSNGGAAWVPCSNIPGVALKSVKYINGTNLITAGGTIVLRSFDGGLSWLPESIKTNKELFNVSAKGLSNLLIVGRDGVIFSNRDVHVNASDEKDHDAAIIKTCSLDQNYPNPFNPVTRIIYSLSSTGKVRLVVFDILGREVKVLVDEVKSAGKYSVDFSASDLSSGVYFYQIKAGNFVQTKKMLLLK